jgi:hypothetical protein
MNVYDAKIQTSESVGKMLEVIDRLALKDSGKYFTYEGDFLPW